MATCVDQPQFEEIGISYRVTENYFITPNKIILKTSKKFDDILSLGYNLQYTDVTDVQTDRRMDTGRQQRPRLRIASRGKKNYTKLKQTQCVTACTFIYSIAS